MTFIEAEAVVEDRISKVLMATQVAQLVATSGHTSRHAYEPPTSSVVHNKLAEILRKYLPDGVQPTSPSAEVVALCE
eukprot:2319510-Amphidinium_carterae.1